MGFGGGGFFFLGFLPMPICEEGRGGQCRVGDGETSGGKRRPSKNPRENRVDDEGTRVPGRAFRVPTARRARWDDGDGNFQEAASITRGASRCAPPRTSCSMCPMSSSMSDCFSSGWNASPLGPRARAIGAHDPSSFHRAIGRR